mgnify:CR=1 FL=1
MFSILIESPSDRIQDDMISMIDKLKNKETHIILITTNKPYKTVRETLKRAKINTDNISFIDCVSLSIEQDDNVNVSFILDISDLSSLSIMVKKYFERIHGKKFLFLDAVHTLWIYRKSNIIARFVQGIIEHAYHSDTNIIFFIVDINDKDLLRKIVPLFDYFVHYKRET